MCGITGFLTYRDYAEEGQMESIINRMSQTLTHRGPDDSGSWLDPSVGLALGHRRLSIIDLSQSGHQPMISVSGRYIITYNGEIYNFRVLHKTLENCGHHFRGHSDTEIMLAAIEEWGLEKAVQSFTGMFAFALWDRQDRVLHLVRDRVGEKPLYYGWMGKTFLFGSELKALVAHPDFIKEIDQYSLVLYLRYNYIPAPYTIFQRIMKLMPGCILSLSFGKEGIYPKPVPYWSAAKIVQESTVQSHQVSDQEVLESLENLLKKTVAGQMVSDVPLGAFLSGGIDSSTIVALMQAQSSRPVKTFTIGFHEDAYNEARQAQEIARYLGTEHTELYVSPSQALDVVPLLPSLYDEPFADSSQIPTFLVAQMTRKKVTVSLSGDGGDEVFGGYNRYIWGKKAWESSAWIPKSIKQGISGALKKLSPQTWDNIFTCISPVLPKSFRQRLPGEKIHKLAEVISCLSQDEMYRQLVSTWKNPEHVVLNAQEKDCMINHNPPDLADFSLRMMYLDLITYLPDDILVKVDRASMGVSLESRIPFLNHHVIEYAWKMPVSMKIRDGVSKWPLRQILYKYVPAELVDRPKMGFGVPIDSWLRGPLRDWAETLLSEARLRRDGFFNVEEVRQKWLEHLSGKRNWQHHLWSVLMFQAWYDKWGGSN